MKTNEMHPDAEKRFNDTLSAMCRNYVPFEKNKPRTQADIDKMVASLTEFCHEKGVTVKDIAIVHAQVWVLRGEAKASDFFNISRELTKAVKTTEKWLQGKVYDEAMFE